MGKHDLKGNSIAYKLLSYLESEKYDDVLRAVNKTLFDNIIHLTRETPVIEREFNCFTIIASTETIKVYFHGDALAAEQYGELYIDVPSYLHPEELTLNIGPCDTCFELEELRCVGETAPFFAGCLNVTHKWDFIEYGDMDDDTYRLIIIMDPDIETISE